MDASGKIMEPEKNYIVFQDPLWKESIQAIKDATRFNIFQNFRKNLESTLPQNSEYVRKRNANTIIKRFFPEHVLDTLPVKVWKFYRDEVLLQEVMRYQYLKQEPVVADFVVNYLLPLAPGTDIKVEYMRSFIVKTYGSDKKKSRIRLGTSLRDLGFVFRNKGKTIVKDIPQPKTALLILAHYLFAPTPRTVTIKEILADPYWQYLGIRDQNTVRKILREANAKELIAKYVIADELEQITTRYSLEEFIQGRMKL